MTNFAYAEKIGYAPFVKHFGNQKFLNVLNEENHLIFIENQDKYRFYLFENSFYENTIGISKNFNLYNKNKWEFNMDLGLAYGYRGCYKKRHLPSITYTYFEKNNKTEICTEDIFKILNIRKNKNKSTNLTITPIMATEIAYKMDTLNIHTFIFFNALGFGISKKF